MQKRSFVLALVVAMAWAVSGSAKVWLLPDYQEKQLYSNRTNSPEDKKDTPKADCRSYGMISASELEPGMVCQNSSRIKDMICYSGCSCPDAYKYSDSSCRSAGKIPSGNACNGLYTECICDTSLYPHTSSSCVPTLSGASCTDDAGTHFEKCVTDPCTPYENYTLSKDCPYNCKVTTENCDSRCVECYADTCEWPENAGLPDKADCEYGCQLDVKGCDTKCKQCKTCVPCGAGYLTACPANTVCNDTCTDCDGVAKFKPTGCATGYGDYNTYWCNQKPQTIDCESLGYKKENISGGLISVECADGATKLRCPFDSSYYICAGEKQLGSDTTPVCGSSFTLSSCPTNGNCEECGGKFRLTDCKSGYKVSGNTCVAASCTTGYATAAAGCGTAPVNGKWTLGTATNGYSGTIACKNCVRTCNSGYKLSGTSCVACNCIMPDKNDYYEEGPSDCDIYGNYEGCNSQGMIVFDELGYNKDLNAYNTCVAQCK